MKKFFAVLLAAAMVCAVAACGSDGGENPSGSGESGGNQEADGGTSTAAPQGDKENIEDALALLTAVWGSYGEDEKFAAAGGDYSEENMVTDAPGRFGVSDPALLDQTLGLPEASASMIDGAASLMHMMNANTFTCGAYHVAKAEDVTAVADSLKENILKRQWMCGFPEKLIVITVDDYVVSAFGNGEIIETFKTKLMSVYESAVLAYEENIE